MPMNLLSEHMEITPESPQFSRFTSPQGWDESSLILSTAEQVSLEAACEMLHDTYLQTLKQQGLSPATQAFTRLHLSDIANQADIVRKSPLYDLLSRGAVSMIEQTPLFNGPISLHAQHIGSADNPPRRVLFNYDSRSSHNGAVLGGDHYQLLWLANYAGRGEMNAEIQTRDIFNDLSADVIARGMSLRRNLLRTWIYVRDIDNHYAGMVAARRELFDRIGLSDDTRFVASTGIEGKSPRPLTLVSLDALAIGNINESQIVRMEALDHMPPTMNYGVTFERGLRIRFGDRSHLYISGTASIDSRGDVLHPGDIARQTRRTLENITALLAPHGAALCHLAYLYVYVRDFSARDVVRDVVARCIPDHIPVVYLHGAVCRPAWLVEMEAVAIIPDSTDFPALG